MSKIRKYTYIFLIVSFVALTACIILFNQKEPAYSFKERTGPISLTSEWLNTKAAIQGQLAEIRSNPNNLKVKLNLAQAYMQEARVTGDHVYYDTEALELLNSVLRKEPENFEALCCKSSIYLSQHHFSDALGIAQKALAINQNSAFIYGLLCDANVELGNYPEAIKMADKMISIRPDLRSYSRVSYLREIHGHTQGAIDAMKLAVSAGYPGLEQSEWVRVNLGHLYESTGDLQNAEMQYAIALNERPDYPFALAGLARIEKARKNYPKAIKYLQQAKFIIREYSFSEDLADLYRLNREPEKANAAAEEAIAMLSGDAQKANDNENIGHYSDRELAYAYLKSFQYDKALEHAEIEYKRRPDNIDACEALAWVHYKRREYKQANDLIKVAMRTNSQSPTLLCRAGLIKIKAGEAAEGNALVKKAMSLNPYMNWDLAYEATPYLAIK